MYDIEKGKEYVFEYFEEYKRFVPEDIRPDASN
jgi:hypothetical protein